jgi:hypothetical protein
VISSGLKREKDAVATEKQFSLNQLEAVIQASRGEIVTELRRMGAVEHKGEHSDRVLPTPSTFCQRQSPQLLLPCLPSRLCVRWIWRSLLQANGEP